jgi:hypothetical protein
MAQYILKYINTYIYKCASSSYVYLLSNDILYDHHSTHVIYEHSNLMEVACFPTLYLITTGCQIVHQCEIHHTLYNCSHTICACTLLSSCVSRMQLHGLAQCERQHLDYRGV